MQILLKVIDIDVGLVLDMGIGAKILTNTVVVAKLQMASLKNKVHLKLYTIFRTSYNRI